MIEKIKVIDREEILTVIGILIITFIGGALLSSHQNIPQYEIDKATTACEDKGGVYIYGVALNDVQVCTCKNGEKIYIK
jgi:hypothetical protein